MKLSIIVPLLNEIGSIENLVTSLNFLDGIEKEIILVDGGSTDGTVDRIISLQNDYSNLKLIDNPQKYVSYAFNKAFGIVKGKYIALIGAHSIYSSNYFRVAVKHLDNNDCDVVGGVLEQKGKNEIGRSIAFCMSSRFGVGNTEFRVIKKKMFVDSVAFAVYKKKVFEEIGLFDEELIRNQDDEFHYRLNAAGYKILMTPEIHAEYYVRGSLEKLFSQYYGYGYYKPLVFKKVPSGKRWRHFIPAMFVLYLFCLPLGLLCPLIFLPGILYLSANIYFSFFNDLKIKEKIISIGSFFILHFSYGIGFLFGVIKFWRYKTLT